MAKIVQGRVLDITPIQDSLRNGDFRLSMEFDNGSRGERLIFVGENDDNIKVGDVLRAIEMTRQPHQYENPTYSTPELFNAVSLGNVAIDTKQRTHYKFGDKITGTVIKNTGRRFAMDADFYFSKIKLDNGEEVEVTLPDRQRSVGTRITGTVGNSAFSSDGKDLHSAGFGNLGGMPLLFNVRETPHNILTRATSCIVSYLRKGP